MKRLSFKEFHDRLQAIAEAEEIFIPHITTNVSVAFELYQKVLADKERQLRLVEERLRDYSILHDRARPKCPDCGAELGLRLINTPKGKGNVHGYKSAWVCEEGDCVYEAFYHKTLEDWLEELPRKTDLLKSTEVNNGR